jgi:hypothetical protein
MNIAILICGLISLFAFILGSSLTHKKYDNFVKINIFQFLGIYTKDDAIFLGFLWSLLSLVCYLIKDWLLFVLIFFMFWFTKGLNNIYHRVIRYFPISNKSRVIWSAKLITRLFFLSIIQLTAIFCVYLWLKSHQFL